MPPKKAKGAGSAAKAKNTPAQLDPEAKRLDARRRIADLKAKVAAEEKLTKLNTIKVENKWRDVMRDAKSTSLTTSLHLLQSSHRRTLAHLSRTLSHLEQQLTEAVDQHADAARGHLENVEGLVKVQEIRMEETRLWFESEVMALEEEFGRERTTLLHRHATSRAQFLHILRRSMHLRAESEADARHEHQSALDDVRNRDLEERHAARIGLEAQVEEVAKRIMEADAAYDANTLQRRKDFEDLKTRDAQHAKEIDHQIRRLVKLSETIGQLRARSAATQAEHEERVREVRGRRDKVQQGFAELKKRMAEARRGERERLAGVTVASAGAIERLRERVDVAEKILRLAEMNAKLETEGEAVAKAVAWGEAHKGGMGNGAVGGGVGGHGEPGAAGTGAVGKGKSDAAEGGEDGSNAEPDLASHAVDALDLRLDDPAHADLAPPSPTTDIALHLPPLPKHPHQLSASTPGSTSPTPLPGPPSPDFPLHHFHARLNSALLSTLHLRSRRAALREENANLRRLMQEYLDGVSVSGEVLERPNPLFVVNGRTNVEPRRLARGDHGPKTVIEAAHVAGRVTR